MKQIFFSAILFLSLIASHSCYAQDRIIFNNGDTLRCTIRKETKNYLHFKQDFNGVSTKGKIQKENIREWAHVQGNETAPKQEIIPVLTTTDHKTGQLAQKENETLEFGKIRASLTAGSGFLLGDTEEAITMLEEAGVNSQLANDYYDELIFGNQLKASIHFHWYKNYWLGAMYSGYYSKAELTTSIPMDEVNMYYGKMGERQFVNFAGVSLYSASRYGAKKKIGLNSSVAIGPVFFRNELETLNEQILIQGISFGMHVSLGLEYFIKPQLSLTIEPVIFASTMKKVSVKTGESSHDMEFDEEDYQNLSRFELSLGLVYYW